MSSIRLRLCPADGQAHDHVTEVDTLVVGRSSHCDIPLADRFLSRQHARFWQEDGRWLVEDLGSRNGTYVNGHRIAEPTPVEPGDVISLSASSITVTRAPGDPASVHPVGSVFRLASDILGEAPPAEVPADAAGTQLRQALDRLQVINDVHEALAAHASRDALLDRILDLLFVHFDPHQGVIFLAEDDTVRVAASRVRAGAAEEPFRSHSLVDEVIGKGLAALVVDTASDDRFAEAQSLIAADVKSLIAAPLLSQDAALGMIVLSSHGSRRQFTEADMKLLVAVASAAALRIRNLLLLEEAAERHRLEQELALARRIQLALLPTTMPRLHGFDVYGHNTPSRGVSGDYFQVLPHGPDDHLSLIVADVSGKGIGAALLTGYVDALFLAFLGEGLEPAQVLARVSPRLHAKSLPDQFATAFVGIVHGPTGTLRYASAGHDPGILVRASGEHEWLMPTGLPIGLLGEASYGSAEATLREGDTLVLYTDGITEAANPDEEELGRHRLAEICARHRAVDAEALAEAIHGEVDAFAAGVPYHDDRTLVIVKRR